MARLFLVARGADRPHLEIARVELRGQPLDDATLARRIPAFEHEDAALAVGDMRRLDALEPLLECDQIRSEEHTSELQSLMRISYAVFCLKKKKANKCTKIDNTKLQR